MSLPLRSASRNAHNTGKAFDMANGTGGNGSDARQIAVGTYTGDLRPAGPEGGNQP